MEEKIVKRILEWLALNELNDYIQINKIWSNDIDNYHESIYVVTEQHPNDSFVDVGVLRLFGFDNNINLSQDYYKVLTFDSLVIELPKLIKLVMDRIGD